MHFDYTITGVVIECKDYDYYVWALERSASVDYRGARTRMEQNLLNKDWGIELILRPVSFWHSPWPTVKRDWDKKQKSSFFNFFWDDK